MKAANPNQGLLEVCSGVCAAGWHGTKGGIVALDQSEACVKCEIGRWSISVGVEVCNTTCAVGTYGAVRGATSALVGCGERCAAGRFGEMRGGTGTIDGCSGECAKGKWSGVVGASTAAVCVPCAAGKWSNRYALSSAGSCYDCGAGRFASATGAIAAFECNGICPTGRYSSTSGLTSAEECSACPADFVAAAGQTTCFACEDGYVPNPTATSLASPGAARCVACTSGRYERKEANHTCDKCPRGRIAPALSTQCFACAVGTYPNPATLGECKRCPASRYHASPSDRGCVQCPSSAGVQCIDSALQIASGYWLAPILALSINDSRLLRVIEVSRDANGNPLATASPVDFDNPSYVLGDKIDSDTALYRCATDGACVEPPIGAQYVKCDASSGHTGVLCGGCATDGAGAGWVRNGGGFLCSECPLFGFSLFVIIAAIVFLSLFSLYWCMSPSRPYNSRTRPELAVNPNDHSRAAFKLLMSHSQLLHALASYTARTRVPIIGVSWWAQIMSGALTTGVAIKCVFGSQFAAPFVLTLSAPLVCTAIVAFMLLIPISFLESRKRKSRKVETFGTEAPGFRARWLVSVGRAGGKRDRFIAVAMPCWPHVALSAVEQREWRVVKEMERVTHFSPIAKLVSLVMFISWALYPSIVQVTFASMRCTDPIDGSQYMVADLTEKCYTPSHITMIIASVASCIVYIIGMPLGAATIVLFLRKFARSGERRVVDALGFITAGNVEHRGVVLIAWEVGAMVLRLAIVAVGEMDPHLPRPDVFADGAVPQSLAAIVILAIALAIQARVRPHAQRWIGSMYETSFIVLISTEALALAAHTMRTSGAAGADALAIVAATALSLLNAAMLILLIVVVAIAKVRKRRAGWRPADSDEHTIASEKKGKRGGKLGALKALIDRAVRALEPYVTERWDEGTFVPAHDLELVWTYTAEKMARFEAADAKKVLIKAKQEASAAKRAGKKIAKPRSIDVSNAHEVKREVVVAAPAGLHPAWLDQTSGEVAPIALTRRLDLSRVPPMEGYALGFVDTVGSIVDLQWRRQHGGIEPAWRSEKTGAIIRCREVNDCFRPRVEWRNIAARTAADTNPLAPSRVLAHLDRVNFDGIVVGGDDSSALGSIELTAAATKRSGGAATNRRASTGGLTQPSSGAAAAERRASSAAPTAAQRGAAERARRLSVAMGVPLAPGEAAAAEPPAAPTTSHTGASKGERRVADDGALYTREEFIAHYSGVVEWDAAGSKQRAMAERRKERAGERRKSGVTVVGPRAAV